MRDVDVNAITIIKWDFKKYRMTVLIESYWYTLASVYGDDGNIFGGSVHTV